MIFISHRGNIDGSNEKLENSPSYVIQAIEKGFDVEIDVWLVDGRFFLGHDTPQYEVDSEFLKMPEAWCHAKNISALEALLSIGVNCFFHDVDEVVLTSERYMWTYPGKEITHRSIVVMPENFEYNRQDIDRAAGICSDFIHEHREKYVNNT